MVMRWHLLVFIKNWLVTPGWSTSCMALANRAAMISRSVKTAWNREKQKQVCPESKDGSRSSSSQLTSKAGVDRRTWVDCTTSAA